MSIATILHRDLDPQKRALLRGSEWKSRNYILAVGPDTQPLALCRPIYPKNTGCDTSAEENMTQSPQQLAKLIKVILHQKYSNIGIIIVK